MDTKELSVKIIVNNLKALIAIINENKNIYSDEEWKREQSKIKYYEELLSFGQSIIDDETYEEQADNLLKLYSEKNLPNKKFNNRDISNNKEKKEKFDWASIKDKLMIEPDITMGNYEIQFCIDSINTDIENLTDGDLCDINSWGNEKNFHQYLFLLKQIRGSYQTFVDCISICNDLNKKDFENILDALDVYKKMLYVLMFNVVIRRRSKDIINFESVSNLYREFTNATANFVIENYKSTETQKRI